MVQSVEGRMPSAKTIRRWLAIAIPIMLLLGLITWRLAERRSATAAQADMRSSRSRGAVSAELTTVSVREIVTTYQTTGSVEPVQNVIISSQASGLIEHLKLREGDPVRQGQILVRIDGSELQADVQRQQAALAEARHRLAQASLTESTADTSVVTQIRQQEAALASALAEMQQTEETRRAQIEGGKASIAEAEAKVESAQAAVANAGAGVRSAQANLDNAVARYNRTDGLYQKGFVSTQDVENARTAVSVQQAYLDTARGQLTAATAAAASIAAQRNSVLQQTNITRARTEADVKSAQARVTQARASLEYARSNSKQSEAYRQNLAALRAGVDAARASLESARARLRNTLLRSPLDGVVTARHQDQGALVSSGQPILTVQAMKKLWVTLAVPEDVVVKINLNDPVKTEFDALDGRSFQARVAQINPSADSRSRLYTVRVILDNGRGLFKPGMFAKATLTTGKVSSLAVPQEAVQKNSDGGNYVVVVGQERKAEHRPVVTGLMNAGWIAITEGLEDGAQVVTMSASPVRPGQQIGSGKGRGKASGKRREKHDRGGRPAGRQ